MTVSGPRDGQQADGCAGARRRPSRWSRMMGDSDWMRRTTAEEPRLSEIVTLYEDLGFEVWVEPFCEDDPYCEELECAECYRDPEVVARLRVVFTRRLADDE